jgi:hypothetical protein
MARAQWRPRREPHGEASLIDAGLVADLERDLALRWHRQSEHILQGIGLGEPGCTCLAMGHRLRTLVTGLLVDPLEEPPGLGAVVANPVTGEVWVRAAHPQLPSPGPDGGRQDWTDPASGSWFVWQDLPQPLLVRAKGWEPGVPQPLDVGDRVADKE